MKEEILKKVDILYTMWKQGSLGGEIMPEDANPHLEKSSLENYLYFTLPMALNYQRNSYILWENANKTYQDEETRFVFNPHEVLNRTFSEVQSALTKYKVALQKDKQTEIWIQLCTTFVELFDGDIRNLFNKLDNDVNQIKDFIQKENKKQFPYLSGTKICNYWLYVIWQYTDRKYKNIEDLTVAPDTHVCKATYRLGLITEEELNASNVQLIVIERWNQLFKGTKYKPIDIHTALWLWSRNGFKDLDESILDNQNIKNIIKNAYEKNNYLEQFRQRELLPFEQLMFDRVINMIPKHGNILDLGCGNGYPYDHYFYSKGFNLVGIDFCEKHINEAKKINPRAQYFIGDMETYEITDKYDLVLMLFSLLHLPREKHQKILQNVYNCLNDEGILLLTLRDEDAGTIKYKKDFCNEEMIWSYYDYETYMKLLKEVGFKLLFSENQNQYGIEESHNWVILRKEVRNMEKLKHVVPTKEYESQAIDYIKEFYEYNSEINGTGGLQKYLDNYDGWLERLEDNRKRIPSEERVPSETYFLVRESDNRIVGMINIRLALNERLKKFGGHIGYSIRPTERQKGYNKVNLYLALLCCQEHGIDQVLMDCDKDNPGSAKTMQALGGKMIREYYDDVNVHCVVQDYIIDVNDAIEKNKDIYEPMISRDVKLKRK